MNATRAQAIRCLQCGADVALERRKYGAVTCSEACARKRDNARDRARSISVHRVLCERARNRLWAEAHRNVIDSNPWLSGPPPYDAHLPGASTAVSWWPPPRWPMQLRNARGLHGAITAIRDEQHVRWPAWALFPYADGWALHWSKLADAERFANTRVNGTLWDRPTEFRFGPLFRMRAPRVVSRGRRRLRIDAITPIVMTTMARTRSHVCPTSEILQGALSGELCYRLSPTHRDDAPKDDSWARWVQPRVRLEIVERHTEPAHVDLGGKFGRVSGWQGHVVVEVNAVAHWLLLACERGLGLGGRGAFGFGRIRVTEVKGD